MPSMDHRVALQEVDERLIELLGERVALMATAPAEQQAWLLSSETQRAARERSVQLGLDPDTTVGWLMHAANICEQASRKVEPIAFLGPIYSYSYLAAVKHFGLAAHFVPVATIAAAFEEVSRGHSRFAVVPIENSTDGRVVDTLGMFARTPVEICGEVNLPIHHCLLGRCNRAEIREVQSKPQALSQCRGWLAEHLPSARLVEVGSTAIAAAQAAVDIGVAAIASKEAGIHHGLKVIDENIEDNLQNVTRFAVIGNRTSHPTGNDKTSLMFQLEHRPGTLANAMVAFQSADVNLTWIESFPLPNCPSEYLFFVELEGHRESDDVRQAIANLKKQTLRLDVLGSYSRGTV